MTGPDTDDLEPGATETIETVDRPDRRRYELLVDGHRAGFVRYALAGQRITLIHTEMDPAHGGRGLGQRLARDVLADARVRGLRVRPLCPFFARFIAAHPAYQDLVV